jgi:ankyrin repeat protein
MADEVILQGGTPIHNAAFHGHLKTIQVLTAAGADLNRTDSDRSTPLHYAAYNGSVSCVSYPYCCLLFF